MKNTVIYFAFITLFAAATSCSKCYNCSYVTETKSGTTVHKDTVNREICTADSREIKEREQNGEKCASK